MAGYWTNAEIAASFDNPRLVELTATAAGTTIDTAKLDASSTDQSRLADSYLSRYSTPLTAAVAIAAIKPHVFHLIIYDLFKDRLAADRFKWVTDDRNSALEWLKMVAKGEISIPGASERTSTLDEQDEAFTGSMDQVFGDGTSL